MANPKQHLSYLFKTFPTAKCITLVTIDQVFSCRGRIFCSTFKYLYLEKQISRCHIYSQRPLFSVLFFQPCFQKGWSTPVWLPVAPPLLGCHPNYCTETSMTFCGQIWGTNSSQIGPFLPSLSSHESRVRSPLACNTCRRAQKLVFTFLLSPPFDPFHTQRLNQIKSLARSLNSFPLHLG